MSNDITELRSALFDTLRDLKAGKMDLDSAKTINETAQTIINSVKVEVDHMRVAGGFSAFVTGAEGETPKLAHGQSYTTQTPGGIKKVTQLPGATVTQHRMGG